MFNRTSLHIAMLLWGCVFSLIAALCMFMSKNFDKAKRRSMIGMQLCSFLLLLNDAFAWGYRGNQSALGFYIVRISNFMVFVLSDILLFLLHGYLCLYLFGCRFYHSNMQKTEKVRKNRDRFPKIRVTAVYLIAGISAALVIISQFTHWYYTIDSHNYYHRNIGHIWSLTLPMLGMLIDLSLILQYRNRLSTRLLVSMLSYILLPFAGTAVLTVYYGISLTNLAICIALILMFVTAMMEQNENLARKEKEAADMRITMMLSQIAPHFIYNTLSSIRHLCTTDPDMAAETVSEFAAYLRGNLDALSGPDMIPFDKEWQHVCNYLAIEQKRFGDRIRVEHTIQVRDFLVPPMALQQIVENAVKHGICKNTHGGTIVIKTARIEKGIILSVTDDGVGFAPESSISDGRNHVGIDNVRNRVENMCSGTVTISSEIGKGTEVLIMLPYAQC